MRDSKARLRPPPQEGHPVVTRPPLAAPRRTQRTLVIGSQACQSGWRPAPPRLLWLRSWLVVWSRPTLTTLHSGSRKGKVRAEPGGPGSADQQTSGMLCSRRPHAPHAFYVSLLKG